MKEELRRRLFLGTTEKPALVPYTHTPPPPASLEREEALELAGDANNQVELTVLWSLDHLKMMDGQGGRVRVPAVTRLHGLVYARVWPV